MLEIVVFSVILLAAGYWTTLFVMVRRDDVIYGKFVHAEDELAPAIPAPLPRRPAKVQAKPVNSDALQSLLAAIQRDLTNVA